MSTLHHTSRVSQTASILENTMVAVGVLVALAVAVMMLALTTARRSSAGLTSPTTAHPTAAQMQPIAHPRP